jgi:hypothetical protein
MLGPVALSNFAKKSALQFPGLRILAITNMAELRGKLCVVYDDGFAHAKKKKKTKRVPSLLLTYYHIQLRIYEAK